MSPIADRQDPLFRKLLVADVHRQLPGTCLDAASELTADEYSKLLTKASAFALSNEAADRTLAYEIASRIVEITEDGNPRILVAADVILSRLGNFPGRKLLRDRYNPSEAKPAFLELEIIAREIENTAAGIPHPLTDFQFQLYDTLGRSRSTSVSAPTSAGKSFVLSLDIIRRLRSGQPTSIVYVVPTRALIRQVMLRIGEELLRAGLRDTAVRCVPLPITPEEAPSGIVYVLTQERLMSLLNSDDGEAWITTLLIDEAQGIKDGARGIILQTAIDSVLFRFAGAQIVFASPLARNPEYLLTLFNRLNGASFVERHSPVSQNRILVEPAQHRRATQFTLLDGADKVPLGDWKTGLRLSGTLAERKAQLARMVTAPDDCTILYENGADDAEEAAVRLSKLSVEAAEVETDDPEILEFISFLRDHIHAEYPLIDVLKHRIAFHFGEMPPIVRSRIEDLFATNKLRFIACTSTLLQGVNLPAKNIIIERPYKGKNKPMDKADFENLAGRAGRLLKEFHGNVWCIRPEEWPSDCLSGDPLQEITSAFTEAFRDGGKNILEVAAGRPLKDEKAQELATAALGKLFSEYIARGVNIEDSPIWNPEKAEELRALGAACTAIPRRLHPSVFARNATVSPMRLESLLDFLVAQPDITAWMPLPFNNPASYNRMKDIFGVIWARLENRTGNSFEYHTMLGWSWIRDTTLRALIEQKIRSLQEGPEKYRPAADALVSTAIRRLMKDIESLIRFHYVKGLKAYSDVLKHVLLQKGHEDLAESIIPLHLFLECGASDHVSLGLISIGLSRTTALLIKNLHQLHFPEDATPEICRAILRGLNLTDLDLPPLCRRELKEVLG